LHEVDEIIVIKEGQISENGTFKQLMKNKGHLSKLIGDHVQLINEKEEELELESPLEAKKVYSMSKSKLNNSQITNRRTFSLANNNAKTTDENLAIHIEKIQHGLIGSEGLSRENSISVFERNRMSVVSMHETEAEEEVIPSDSEPMKLVLEDQSVNYKQTPLVSYLRAGTGVVATLALVILFFLVHLVRIGSGKNILGQIKIHLLQ